MHEAGLFGLDGGLVGVSSWREKRVGIRGLFALQLVRALATHAASMMADHVEHDPGEPRANRGPTFELSKALMDNDEDLLHDVIDGGRTDAETASTAPDESQVVAIHLRKESAAPTGGSALPAVL